MAMRDWPDGSPTTWRGSRGGGARRCCARPRRHSIADGVARVKRAIAAGETPVAPADHSDRSGSATWLLREIIAQGLSNTLTATIADAGAIARLEGVKAGTVLDLDARRPGATNPRANPCVIRATVQRSVGGIRSNVGRRRVRARATCSVISPYLVQIMEPVDAVRHRSRSRRVLGHRHQVACALPPRLRRQRARADDPPGSSRRSRSWARVRLDALPYEHVDLRRYDPYGVSVVFGEPALIPA